MKIAMIVKTNDTKEPFCLLERYAKDIKGSKIRTVSSPIMKHNVAYSEVEDNSRRMKVENIDKFVDKPFFADFELRDRVMKWVSFANSHRYIYIPDCEEGA